MNKKSLGSIEIGIIILLVGWFIAYYFPELDGSGIVIWLIGFIIIPIILIVFGIYEILKEIKTDPSTTNRGLDEGQGSAQNRKDGN